MTISASSRQIISTWRDDPVAFCNDVFAMKPREWQPKFLRSVASSTKKRIAIKACRDAGKTSAAAYLALWWLCTHPYSLVLTTAPTWKQVEQVLWVEIRKLWWSSCLPRLFPKWECLTVGIKTTHPEWRAFGLSSDHPENFEGAHGRAVLVIYDEAKRVDRLVYEMLQGLLTNIDWREVAISTPGTTAGWFYSAFTDDSELWDLHSINAFEIDRLRPKAEAEMYRLGEQNGMFRQQWLAEFSPAETGTLFPFQLLDAAINVDIKSPENGQPAWPRIIGVDPAGKGTDEFALCFRHGPIIETIEAWKGWDEMQSVGEVVKHAVDYRWKTTPLIGATRVSIEKPGLGGPIIAAIKDGLRERGWRGDVVEFNPGERAYQTEVYDNLKTEIAFGLRERLSYGEIKLPNDGRLKGQLASYNVGTSRRGLTKILDPTKEGSPDRADSLICAFAGDFTRPSVATGRVNWL